MTSESALPQRICCSGEGLSEASTRRTATATASSMPIVTLCAASIPRSLSLDLQQETYCIDTSNSCRRHCRCCSSSTFPSVGKLSPHAGRQILVVAVRSITVHILYTATVGDEPAAVSLILRQLCQHKSAIKTVSQGCLECTSMQQLMHAATSWKLHASEGCPLHRRSTNRSRVTWVSRPQNWPISGSVASSRNPWNGTNSAAPLI